ncbi:18893_t:CDS:1, partial [Funneliformis geosporum]
TILSHLPKESRELLASQDIKHFITLQQRPLVNYISYCNNLDLEYTFAFIYLLIDSDQQYDYQRYALEQEIFKLFMSECSSIKSLTLKTFNYDVLYKHQLHNFFGANDCLPELVHLTCITKIDPSFFYGLSLICKRLEKISLISFLNENVGLNRFISVQQKLKIFEFEIDKFHEIFNQDKAPLIGLGIALLVHSDNLLQFSAHLDREINFPPPEFYRKFKNMRVVSLLNRNHRTYFEGLFSQLDCPKLEILQLGNSSQSTLSKIVSKTQGSLNLIRIRKYFYDKIHSKELFQIIYQHCPKLSSVNLVVDQKDLKELQQILINCRCLTELILVSTRTHGSLNCGILELIVTLAPLSLNTINLMLNWEISVEGLIKFLENWEGRKGNQLTFKTYHVQSMTNEHIDVLQRYKEKGIIKMYRNTCSN